MIRIVLGLAIVLGACGATTPAPAPSAPKKEFAMRVYYMGFLRRGPAWTAEQTPEATAIGEGHMAHIGRMARCGKLVLAGPFDVPEGAPADALAGIFVFDVATIDEAVALTSADPAVKAGRFTMEVVPWYGPVGLTYDGAEPPTPGASCTE